MSRYTALVEAPNSRSRVEPIRRLRAVAGLLAAVQPPHGAVGFITWLGGRARSELVRAAAGLADIGDEPLADRLRAVLPASDTKAVRQLLAMDNGGLAARKRLGQRLAAAAPSLAEALRAFVEANPQLRPDAALPEVPTLPAGRRRWRVPAVSTGGLAGAAEVVADVAVLLGHTVSRTRQRVEDRVRGEGHPEVRFEWGEPLQCVVAIAAEHDSEPPPGAIAGDEVIRPVAPPTQAVVEAISSLLPEDDPRRVRRRDGRLQLDDRREAQFGPRLAELGSTRRPLTRPERVAQRVRNLLQAFESGGLAGWLVDQRPWLRQGLQALELVGMTDAAQLGRRVLKRLGGTGTPEDQDWATRTRELSSLGRARFEIFEAAMLTQLRVTRFRLFDFLARSGWTLED